MKLVLAMALVLTFSNVFAGDLTCKEKNADGIILTIQMQFDSNQAITSAKVWEGNTLTFDSWNVPTTPDYYGNFYTLEANDTYELYVATARFDPATVNRFFTETITSFFGGERQIRCVMK